MNRRRWIIAGVVAWALAIAGLGLWSYANDPPTARDQTSIADGLPVVDEALGRIYSALDQQGSVSVLGGYTRTEVSCRVTSAREGTRFVRKLTVFVGTGTEPAALDRIKAALPDGYQAAVTHTQSAHILTADAGHFVALRGGLSLPGRLEFTADTGCRIQNAAVTEATPASQNANRAPVQAVLDTLGATAKEWRTHRLTGPGCGALWTVEAVTAGDVAKAHATVPASAIVLDADKVFAYRAGAAGVSLRTEDGSLVVSSTAGC